MLIQIEALVGGVWQGGKVVEGLQSGSVDLAKFHKLPPEVPGFLKNDLKSIREAIIDGTIPTMP